MVFLKNLVAVSLLVVLVTSILSICYLSDYFVRNMPTNPQLELHRTYPLNVHGWIVYLTRSESLLMDCLDGAFFGACLLLFVWKLAFGGGFQTFLRAWKLAFGAGLFGRGTKTDAGSRAKDP